MPDALPTFRYHPDPIGTGSIVASPKTCLGCDRQRGYVYVSPVVADAELSEAICPWCIADGTAATKFDAEFTDPEGVGDYGSWDSVPADVAEEISRRTPGFTGWQQERWWTHCGDGAEFLGRAGWQQVDGVWRDAVPALKADIQLDGDGWQEYAEQLDTEGSPTAYVFKCRHCGQLGGYSDSH